MASYKSNIICALGIDSHYTSAVPLCIKYNACYTDIGI